MHTHTLEAEEEEENKTEWKYIFFRTNYRNSVLLIRALKRIDRTGGKKTACKDDNNKTKE